MEINQILCKNTGKIMKADIIYKVKNDEDNCIEEIVSQCSMCPYSDSGRDSHKTCKNCYGTITQTRKTIQNNKAGRNNMLIENYRNTFIIDEDCENIIRDMDADAFMKHIKIVANMNSLNWNHGQMTDDKLRAYDRSKTWKTDCAQCKNSDEKPACIKAKEYLENKYNTSVEFMSEKQLLSELPANCICKNQSQTLYFV